jgi:hypothetical protein
MMVAVLLIALGIIAFVYQGINYTTRGRDVNVGPFHMTTEQDHHIPLPPLLGAIALIGGIALLLVAKRGANRVAGALVLASALAGLQSCTAAKAVTIEAGRIDQLSVGFALDPQGRVTPGCSASKFASGDPIHLSMQVNDAREGSVVRVAVRDVVTHRIAWNEDRPVPAGRSSLSFAIGRKLGPGRYRAESSLDAGTMSPREFVVHDRLNP